MIKAVIFDMDGLMIDSELLHSMAFKQVHARHGIKVRKKMVQTIGIGEAENWGAIKNRYGLEEDTAKLIQERGKIYVNLLKKDIKAMPGLYKLLLSLKKRLCRIPLLLT